MSVWLWAAALGAYLAFRLWYDNWRGPIAPTEAKTLIERLGRTGAGENGRNDLTVMERFLADDDGREFFMLNVVRLASEPVADPETGELRPASKVLAGYTKMFMPALFARGGHPALVARKVGGHFDTWGMESGPDWSFIGYMRYRSRRDLIMLASDPRFAGAHEFKFLAMPQTFNFPTQPVIATLAGPRVWIGLIIALVAAILQIALLTI